MFGNYVNQVEIVHARQVYTEFDKSICGCICWLLAVLDDTTQIVSSLLGISDYGLPSINHSKEQGMVIFWVLLCNYICIFYILSN